MHALSATLVNDEWLCFDKSFKDGVSPNFELLEEAEKIQVWIWEEGDTTRSIHYVLSNNITIAQGFYSTRQGLALPAHNCKKKPNKRMKKRILKHSLNASNKVITLLANAHAASTGRKVITTRNRSDVLDSTNILLSDRRSDSTARNIQSKCD